MPTFNQKGRDAALETLRSSINQDTTEIMEHNTPEEMTSVVSEIGQRNNTALGDGEFAEFFPMEEYKTKIKDYIVHTQTTSSTGRKFDNLYALVNRYFKVGNKKVGEHLAFINIGNMVRRHYDLTGLTPDAEGKIKGARRVVTPGAFNEKLDSYRLPWAMLEQCLAGKTVKAARSNDKLFFQEFVDRRPVPDKYVEQNYMVYNFAN